MNGTTTTIVKTPTYDHAGRLLKTDLKLNNEPTKTISALKYNKLGQLINKRLQPAGDADGLDITDYTYNIRGWLKSLNSMSLGVNQHFGMELFYNDALGVMSNGAQYNKNISAQKWKTALNGEMAYTYSYDDINRLTGVIPCSCFI